MFDNHIQNIWVAQMKGGEERRRIKEVDGGRREQRGRKRISRRKEGKTEG